MLEQHLEKLIVFVGVVKSGSIRKYAFNHRLSQPGVSQLISSLENHIGLLLLRRSRKGIELTKHGKSIFDFGIRIIDLSLTTEIALYRQNSREIEIRFSTYDSIAIYLMPKVIDELRKVLPHVILKIHCDRSSTIIRNLNEGLIDCGLCMVGEKTKGIEVKILFEDQYGFYKASGNLKDETLITVLDALDQNGKSIEGYLKSFGMMKVHTLAVPSFEIAKAMTIAGLGIGVLPNKVALPSVHSNLLKKTSLPGLIPQNFGKHSFSFIRRKGTPETNEVKILKELIEKQLSAEIP